MEDINESAVGQEWERVAAGVEKRLACFLTPLLLALDVRIDKRLVRTVLLAVAAILENRHSTGGLLLSELGSYILNPGQAPAGTKRLSNLLRCRKWHYGLIDRFLWQAGDKRIAALKDANSERLVIWDESVLEKAESRQIEGLCAVRSSKARQLKRIKPGFFNPPGRPIFVPGMNWVGLLVIGMSGPPVVAAMRWWTTRGKGASDRRTEEGKLLKQSFKRWGDEVVHVFDRGFAGAPWLSLLLGYRQRFIMRWPQNYYLLDGQGNKRKAWEISRGKRSLAQRKIWDTRRNCERTIGIYFTAITHPAFPDITLWLVVSRQGKGQKPWYLITNQPVDSADSAFQLIRAYARRWQIEMAWRYTKSELAFQSPRLWTWNNRLKLLLLATLAYAFLISLLDPLLIEFRHSLLRRWCHRTGKRCRNAPTPLYRLRIALVQLWRTHPRPALDIYSLLNTG